MPVTRRQLRGAGWAGSTPASAVPSSTPADLLSLSPGRPNLFLPVVPGPGVRRKRLPGRAGSSSRVPPPRAADAALPGGPCSPPPPPSSPGTLPAVPGGTWQPVPRSPPQCKGRREGREGRRCPPPRRGSPAAPGEPAAGHGTHGSGRGASRNQTPGHGALPGASHPHQGALTPTPGPHPGVGGCQPTTRVPPRHNPRGDGVLLWFREVAGARLLPPVLPPQPVTHRGTDHPALGCLRSALAPVTPKKPVGGCYTGDGDARGQPRPPTGGTTGSQRDTHPPAGKTWAG